VFNKLDTAKMPGLGSVSCRDEPSEIWAILNSLSAVEMLHDSAPYKFTIDIDIHHFSIIQSSQSQEKYTPDHEKYIAYSNRRVIPSYIGLFCKN